MRVRAVLLAAALVLAPLGARAADLVVWWEEGLLSRGGRRRSGRSSPPSSRRPASRSSSPSIRRTTCRPGPWRRSRPGARRTSCSASASTPHYGRVGLRGPARRPRGRARPVGGPVRPGRARARHPARRARRAGGPSTRCRWGSSTNHVHVWKSLLERAGFTLADIPKEWEPFWSFWCDKVQPAVRKATGRDDIYGVGLAMSACGRSTPTPSSGSS